MIAKESISIATLYPQVSRILVYAAFEEAAPDSEANYQQIIFTPDTEAVFHLACSREGCAGGGFDLTPVIDGVVKSNTSRAQGTLTCGGTLGAQACSLGAEYRVIVD